MCWITFFSMIAVLFFALCLLLLQKKRLTLPRYTTFLVFLSAFVMRCVMAYHIEGYLEDFEWFGTWAKLLYRDGFGAFYSQEMLVDYPPGSLYLLWPIGAIYTLFQLDYYGPLYRLLIKFPAILFDMATGALLYREGRRGEPGESRALVIAVAYLFNPAVVVNSSAWGQVDSFLVFPLLLMCLYLMRGKMPQAYLAYGIGVLLKPQMVMFTPVLLLGILDRVFLQDFSVQKFLHNLFSGLGVIAGMIILCLPFHLDMVVKQFTTTLGSYPYASVNAFNFWNLVDLNFKSQYQYFLFLSSKNWGLLVIFGIVFATFLLGRLMKDNEKKYPILAAFIIITMFTFSVRMHERYMFSGLACLLFAYLYRPTKKLFLCYSACSVVHFCNAAYILLFHDVMHINFSKAVSVATIGCALFLYAILLKDYCPPISTLWRRRTNPPQSRSRKAS